MRKVSYLISLATLLVAPLLVRPVYADDATIYLTPGTANFSQGSLITLQIRENSGSKVVNAVQANLSYDPSELTFSGFVASNIFSIEAENYADNGTVKVARGAFNPVSGDQLVVSLQFVATGTGNSTISFGDKTAVVATPDTLNVLNGNGSGGSYFIQAPSYSQPSTQSGASTTSVPTTIDSVNGDEPAPASRQADSTGVDLLQILTKPDDYPVHIL